ncbi:late secretory pathway protein AVL9 homolog [Macrosteles quadrilineatus]|uniref:late secretory pathway protein AVL9 homolog n=1 Tax=Macrosteles quadrilineatus TaxID=74068 RepID=UPI0023E2E3BC|nr:late secretory pathway protein AVL9 homolog [Macrosteles quadrilineatus]
MKEESVTHSPKPILHVLVVGFHHKKGCQIEYSYPPLNEGESDSECPSGWKYLPTLALPDGSHNYDDDTVYFHLPSLTDPDQTVYGISCFRQIPVEKIKNRTADITRGTVQKSVCVLSSVPLYGQIQVKMSLITHAYFEEGDFTKVSMLVEAYNNLNTCLLQIPDVSAAPQIFVGLSARDLVQQFRHKTLLLFKLLLLERRVVFYRSPVEPLCTTILSLLSLHPHMIEKGLHHCACIRPSRPMSPVPHYAPEPAQIIIEDSEKKCQMDQDIIKEPDKEELDVNLESTCQQNIQSVPSNVSIVVSRDEDLNGVDLCEEMDCDPEKYGAEVTSDYVTNGDDVDGVLNGDKSPSDLSQTESHLPRDTSMDTLGEATVSSFLANVAQVDAEACGCPLQVFDDGYLCLPYLSLPYMDVLMDQNVRGYFVGATNVLFKQKKKLAEVLVEVETGRVETSDLELRRLLHLSTEDLRFADYLVRHVAEEKHDVFVDGVGWEGGDEWIRAQFRAYTLCLLRTSLLQEGSRELDHFNAAFVSAWKHTHNYTTWVDGGGRDAVLNINPGHPFAGQLSVADMKLRLTHTMQNTEGGRKLNQAMVSTGKAVVTTGRAVGGAISQAKGALSSWWSNLTTTPGAEVAEPAAEVEPAAGQVYEV